LRRMSPLLLFPVHSPPVPFSPIPKGIASFIAYGSIFKRRLHHIFILFRKDGSIRAFNVKMNSSPPRHFIIILKTVLHLTRRRQNINSYRDYSHSESSLLSPSPLFLVLVCVRRYGQQGACLSDVSPRMTVATVPTCLFPLHDTTRRTSDAILLTTPATIAPFVTLVSAGKFISAP
jgi:hypothetical protein